MADMKDQMLDFDGPVALVGASPAVDDAALREIPTDWPVIAVDGGLHHLSTIARQAALVLGDMDSVGQIPADLPRLPLRGQDDTDLEKALCRVRAPLIVAHGFLGARFDHSLAALHALMRLDHDAPVMLVGVDDLVVRLRHSVVMNLPVGTRFSIWPLGVQAFIGSEGLKWPLDGLSMQAGTLIGTSNEVAAPRVEVQPSHGDGYAVILPADCHRAVLSMLLA